MICARCGYDGPELVPYQDDYLCYHCLQYLLNQVQHDLELTEQRINELTQSLHNYRQKVDELNRLLPQTPQRPLPDITKVLNNLKSGSVGHRVDSQFRPIELVTVYGQSTYRKIKAVRYKHPNTMYICYLYRQPEIFVAIYSQNKFTQPEVFEGPILYFEGAISYRDYMYLHQPKPLNSLSKEYCTFIKMTERAGTSLTEIRQWFKTRS